ncbi:DUF1674 domain-containing protein [Bartonella bacilliformis]|uniref:DUF1674 domain-containing protein n=1 Tax=Bartonella bacilliformis Ver097 TaxID=1293911 RepID=A0A072R5V0_BARBA|nr:DUF1674 domain-containing protein [Bartonella bacilliformis]KEG21333.1 hypothetical protein H710_00282 [Bartonella bacilliformis Ver097]
MDKKDKKINNDTACFQPSSSLSPAAQRALQEAAERRKHETHEKKPLESGGRGGKDPARYGDWEIKGRAIDF